MATNLRLDDEATAALRAVARASGRSQADLLREAVDRYLGLGATTDVQRALDAGLVEAPEPLVDVEPWVVLPEGQTSLDVLDRDER